jgi:hypothetical protein
LFGATASLFGAMPSLFGATASLFGATASRVCLVPRRVCLVPRRAEFVWCHAEFVWCHGEPSLFGAMGQLVPSWCYAAALGRGGAAGRRVGGTKSGEGVGGYGVRVVVHDFDPRDLRTMAAGQGGARGGGRGAGRRGRTAALCSLRCDTISRDLMSHTRTSPCTRGRDRASATAS